MRIIPAILEPAAEQVLEKINLIKAVTDTVQIDIADGTFVDSATVSLQQLLDAGVRETGAALEFHLMVADPLAYMELCQKLGAKRVFWHYEAAPDIRGMVAQLRRFAFKKGIAVNPATDIAAIGNDCGCLDAVQIMGVQPGRQGAAFVPATIQRVRQLRERYPDLPIVTDGGVGKENVRALLEAGVTDVVVGSGIFGCDDPAACYTELRELIS